VYEWPKKRRVLLSFHTSSAVWRMFLGVGWVVALLYIVSACGRVGGNRRGILDVVSEVDRNDCVIGPQRPCGSIANGRRIMFASRRSLMIDSPVIVYCVVL
jgi:hypothetical protein